MRTALRLLGLTLVAPALAQSDSAHEREFTQSRDWHLPYQGEHEIELRSFFDTSHGSFVGQIEYEYGVTPHFAIEPGLEIRENLDGDYEIEAAELELRFNFGEFRRDAWLPALNLEYEHPFEDESDAVTLKGVLSRYGALDDFTINLNYARQLESPHADGSELTAGWIRRIVDGAEDGSGALKLGLELVQDFERHDLRAGPVASWRISEDVHLLASYLPALNERGSGNFDEAALILEWEP